MRIMWTLVAVVLVVGACSDGGGDASEAGEVKRPADPYGDYLVLAEELGGMVDISAEDAGIRARLLCDGSADDMFDVVPLRDSPTDLALVRAYCPEREADF